MRSIPESPVDNECIDLAHLTLGPHEDATLCDCFVERQLSFTQPLSCIIYIIGAKRGTVSYREGATSADGGSFVVIKARPYRIKKNTS